MSMWIASYLFSRCHSIMTIMDQPVLEPTARTIKLGTVPDENEEPNYICYQRHSMYTFLKNVVWLHCILYFSWYMVVFAFNSYFKEALLPLSYHYLLDISFIISFFKGGVETFRRYRKEKELNGQICKRFVFSPGSLEMEHIPVSKLRVGDVVVLHKGQRVPADMILLRTKETMGTVLIKTDKIDGNINLTVRNPVPLTQNLLSVDNLLNVYTEFFVDKPHNDIYNFIGSCKQQGDDSLYNRVFATEFGSDTTNHLDVNNTMWCGSVLASEEAIGLVIYTGNHTRTMLNAQNEKDTYKLSSMDFYISKYSLDIAVLIYILLGALSYFISNKTLFCLHVKYIPMLVLVVIISLRVNLDITKWLNAWLIQRDKDMAGTEVRSTCNPELMGSLSHLLIDKTGTLTNTETVFVTLHLENQVYTDEDFELVKTLVGEYSRDTSKRSEASVTLPVWEAVLAMALCHDVTLATEVDEDGDRVADHRSKLRGVSADEKAFLAWTNLVGVTLHKRSANMISLKVHETNAIMNFKILKMVPFDPETRVMGIIVQEETSGMITYYLKGAEEAVGAMSDAVWTKPRSDELAESGLRTMVFAKCAIDEQHYLQCKQEYAEEKGIPIRSGLITIAVVGLEECVGHKAPGALELMEIANIKLWVVTGDNIDTALNTVRKLQLGGRLEWRVIRKVEGRRHAMELLRYLPRNKAVAIDATALDTCLNYYEEEWLRELRVRDAVLVSRCSSQQKRRLAARLRGLGLVVGAVGDGRGDGPLLMEADVGQYHSLTRGGCGDWGSWWALWGTGPC